MHPAGPLPNPAGTAAYLNVFGSIYRVLKDLRADGYNVGDLPASEEGLIKSVLTAVSAGPRLCAGEHCAGLPLAGPCPLPNTSPLSILSVAQCRPPSLLLACRLLDPSSTHPPTLIHPPLRTSPPPPFARPRPSSTLPT